MEMELVLWCHSLNHKDLIQPRLVINLSFRRLVSFISLKVENGLTKSVSRWGVFVREGDDCGLCNVARFVEVGCHPWFEELILRPHCSLK